MSRLSDNTRTVHDFREAIERCTLPHVPQITRRILTTEAWRERFEFGRRILFDDLVEFVTQSPSKGGCGLKLDNVTSLLEKAEDTETLKMWQKAIRAKDAQEINAKAPDLKPAHRPKKPDNTENDIRLSGYGTSNAYAIARLRKDRPEIHARVLAGEITPHAGMIEAGFRKKQTSRKQSPIEKLRKLIRKFLPELSEADREQLVRELKIGAALRQDAA